MDPAEEQTLSGPFCSYRNRYLFIRSVRARIRTKRSDDPQLGRLLPLFALYEPSSLITKTEIWDGG